MLSARLENGQFTPQLIIKLQALVLSTVVLTGIHHRRHAMVSRHAC